MRRDKTTVTAGQRRGTRERSTERPLYVRRLRSAGRAGRRSARFQQSLGSTSISATRRRGQVRGRAAAAFTASIFSWGFRPVGHVRARAYTRGSENPRGPAHFCGTSLSIPLCDLRVVHNVVTTGSTKNSIGERIRSDEVRTIETGRSARPLPRIIKRARTSQEPEYISRK